jgi:N-acetylneuraminic acid mutarotase
MSNTRNPGKQLANSQQEELVKHGRRAFSLRSNVALVLGIYLSLALVAGAPVSALAQSSGTWMTTGSLNIARCAHTATLLPDGQVLVAGGEGANGTMLSSAELYNPATGKWTVTGRMATPRMEHTATLLLDGQVLVVGGTNSSTFLSSAELYNPSTGKWTMTGSLTVPRASQGAALLESGDVLVAGGISPAFPGSTSGTATTSAELYDSSAGTFRATTSMIYPAASQATRLERGQVLVPGGRGNTAELYEPSTAQWTLTSTMYFSQPTTDAVLLSNGNVLIYGSLNSTTYSSEFYDPATNVWARTFGQNYGNILSGPLTLLESGKALLAGGAGKYKSILRSAMLYDPATNDWTLTGALNQARRTHTLTLLQDGQALAAGGVSVGANGTTVVISSAELYTP